MEGYNRHHILETRSDWMSNPMAAKLRNTTELIPLMEIEAHKELTRDCPIVPLLGYKALEIVMHDFSPRNGTYTSMDRLLCSINKVANCKSIKEVERRLAELTMEAIELQRPYLKGHIIHNERH